ncbi:MAG TPA: alkaline phosphatase D family protein, partial [Burkholderiales bacterium]|nr:alkaline phosphatase D family protein [Burkholderiales bacterium]
RTADGAAGSRPSGWRFPQGVATADPQPDALVFWTRAVADDQSLDSVLLRLQVGSDPDFRSLVAETEITARAEHDFTVRVFVDGLGPDTRYHYRFLAPDESASRTGRTRTAPAASAQRSLTVAVFSCQHYSDGFFSAYRRLLLDDAAAAPGRAVDFVLHLGDFIYEFPEVDLYQADGSLVRALNPDGSQRLVPPLPSSSPERIVRKAETVDDFRHLYRTYLTDPDLQEARAAYPFVHIWDDHELVNDCWQGFVLAESIHQRRVNANQAWFEYVPAALTHAPAGPAGANPARDFQPVEVSEASVADLDDHYLVREPNNLAAIRSLTISRCLSWGSLADIFLPDQRSYRGERGVDASLLKGSLAPYPLWPMHPETVEILNAGRHANDGHPPDSIEYDGRTFSNPRKDAPLGSMLGAEQKNWLKSSLRSSGATWKVLCNSTPLLRFGLDVSFRAGEPEAGLLWTDSWDGYPVERRELMNFLLAEGIANVVSLSGDRHAHFAGLVYDDYDAPRPRAVIPEFAGASTSAGCRAKVHALEIQHDPALTPLFLSIRNPGSADARMIPTLNAWLLFGAEAARVLHESGSAEDVKSAAKPQINPHLRYADTDAYGYLVAHFGPERLEVEFVTIPEPLTDSGASGPAVMRRVRYVVARWSATTKPELAHPEVSGEPPLFGVKYP